MKTMLPEISLVTLLSSFQKLVSQLYLNVLGCFFFFWQAYPLLLCCVSLQLDCNVSKLLGSNHETFFLKIQSLPSSWIVTPIHRLLLSVSCCLPIWGAPKLWQFNEYFELWVLFSLWGQGHKSLQVSPHPTPVLEREKRKASLLSTPPFFLLADQKKFSQPF